MANVTVYEHDRLPDPVYGSQYPPSVVPSQTSAVPGTVTLAASTVWVEVTADTDCRVGFNTAGVGSGMNISSAFPSRFLLRPATGASRTLQFVANV